MKVALASDATADRLADAALLLLDAARAAVADNEVLNGPCENRTLNITAIAVQAVVMADFWPAGGMKTGALAVTPNQLVELLSGAAMGLGMTLAGIPDASLRMAIMMMIGASVGHGQKVALEARAGIKGNEP